LAATKRFKVGSCESGELFFAFAFLFTNSVSCEGGEKLHYGEKQKAESSFLKKAS